MEGAIKEGAIKDTRISGCALSEIEKKPGHWPGFFC